MQVVILAAGRGKRFLEAGYKDLKPLINVCGEPMIHHALQQARAVTTDERITILCPMELAAAITVHCAPIRVIGVRHTQSGAACTLLTAGAVLDELESVLVMDCDSIIQPQLVRGFARWAEQEFTEDGATSAILCFNSTDGTELWSFVDVHKYERLRVTVREKVRVSDTATCGVHAFKSWAVLRAGLCHLIDANTTYNQEYYLAPIHNSMRAVVHLIPETEFHPIGTPAQLEAYEQAVS